MTNDDPTVQPDPAVARRALFRGGAMLAGAAGISAIGAAVAAPAEAADGDALTVGVANDAESTTGLTIGAAVGSGEAALSLTNADGPSLYLNPLADDWNDQLSPGQIANTTRGPLIGIVQDGEGRNAALLTDQDVWIPFVLPQPMRLVDTRTVLGRQRVTLPSPLTSDGRLPAGEALTFWIAPTEEGFGIPAIHLNITVVKPKSAGYVVVYPGPDRPDTSTVNFPKGRTVANSAFMSTSVGTYRVNAGDPGQPSEVHEAIVATAWIIVDGIGAYATGFNPVAQPDGNPRPAARQRRTPAALAQQKFGKLR
jgi:hypothetical protein